MKGSVAARTLTVGRSGEVAGSVVAEIAQIDGLVEGDLAADTVVLGPTARVAGDITHRSLAVEPGARFEGRAVRSRSAKAAGETDPETAALSPSAAKRRPLRPN